jgi:hypothetical protein
LLLSLRIQQFNPTVPKLSVEPVADFLAGRMPRRKNFAESFEKAVFHPVKQGFSDARTYSQTKAI